MKKTMLYTFGILVFSSVFALREWLLHQEMISTMNLLRSHITQTISSAQTAERVRELSKSSVVYDRYLEPVILVASRLLWPLSRFNAVSTWKREVHTKISDLSHTKLTELGTAAEDEMKKLRLSKEPSVDRLLEALKTSSSFLSQERCQSVAQEELKLIQTASNERDDKLFLALQSEGKTKIRDLKTKLKKMSTEQLAKYFASGDFEKQIERPILDILFQIRQEDLRKNAWKEYQEAIQDILGKKKISQKKKAPSVQSELPKIMPMVGAFLDDSKLYPDEEFPIIPENPSDARTQSAE